MTKNPPKTFTLQLRGELTLSTIAGAHQQLAQALAGQRPVLVDMSYADETDLSLIQLLQSARHTATRDGKTIALKQPLPATLSRDLSRGGFLASSDSAFWTTNG